MRLAVVGSRSFNNYKLLKHVLDEIPNIKVIISGAANGADKLGEYYAKENNIETEIYPADWEKYKKKAGFIRNKDIVNNCDKLIAFWDGHSTGTLDAIILAQKTGKILKIVNFKHLTNGRFK